jgi:hypothetical protein
MMRGHGASQSIKNKNSKQQQRRVNRQNGRSNQSTIAVPSIVRAGGATLPGRSAHLIGFKSLMAPTAGRFMNRINTFPTTFGVPFRWSAQIDGTTDSGSADVNAFSLNSLYDPNITGVGTQPRYFDTLCAAAGGTAPYDTYVVVRSHVRVTMQSNSTTSIFGYVQVYSDTAGISPTCPLNEYLETANLIRVPMTSANNATAVRVVEFDVDIARFLGFEDILDADDCRAQYDANPGRQVYMDVGVRSNSDTATVAFSYTVEIVYEAVLTGLNDTSAFLSRAKAQAVAACKPDPNTPTVPGAQTSALRRVVVRR